MYYFYMFLLFYILMGLYYSIVVYRGALKKTFEMFYERNIEPTQKNIDAEMFQRKHIKNYIYATILFWPYIFGSQFMEKVGTYFTKSIEEPVLQQYKSILKEKQNKEMVERIMKEDDELYRNFKRDKIK